MVRFLVRAVLSKETDHLVASHHWFLWSCGKTRRTAPSRSRQRPRKCGQMTERSTFTAHFMAQLVFPRCRLGGIHYSWVHYPASLGDDLWHLWNRRIFKMFRIRHRHFQATHPRHRSVELLESVFHDSRHDLGRDASGFPAFIDDHCAMRSSHGIDDCLAVQRPQRT